MRCPRRGDPKVNTPVPLDQPVGRAADRTLGALPLTVHLAHDGPPTLGPLQGGVRGALGQLVAEAVLAGARGSLARLKVCSAPGWLRLGP
jgi:hypothetical protein